MRALRVSLTVSVVLALLGGASGAVGVAAREEAVSVPTEFTGHIVCGGRIQRDRIEQEVSPIAEDGAFVRAQHRGRVWRAAAIEMSDPRLEGSYHLSYDFDALYYPGMEVGDPPGIARGTWRIENDEGAWEGSYPLVFLPGEAAPEAAVVLEGEGAYDGLISAWITKSGDDACTWDVRGMVYSGEPIAAPAGYPSSE